MTPPMLDVARIRAITLDLDDTLWPVWPTLERAESALRDWLRAHAPRAGALAADRAAVEAARQAVHAAHPRRRHDVGFVRHQLIRRLLAQAGESEALAEPAFAVFYAARQQVTLFDDALPALRRLSRRYPLVALTNGNADVHRIGIGAYFRAAVAAGDVGVGKPDARMFQAGAQAAGVAVGEVLHIGDDPLLDVAGARAAGMQVAWLDRKGEAATAAGAQPGAHAVAERLDELTDWLRA